MQGVEHADYGVSSKVAGRCQAPDVQALFLRHDKETAAGDDGARMVTIVG